MRFLSGENVAATTTIYQDLQQFFLNSSTGIPNEPTLKKEEDTGEGKNNGA
jgi:hypothetical protein